MGAVHHSLNRFAMNDFLLLFLLLNTTAALQQSLTKKAGVPALATPKNPLHRRAFLQGVTTAFFLPLFQQKAFADDCNPDASNNPCFSGTVETEWLVHPTENDRNMKLLKNFTFVDNKSTVWTVPAGYELNGANIPRPLWSFIGSPFYGDFRRASVVHDYFCEEKRKFDYSSKEVHDIFYQGMLEDGVPRWKATLMDTAVRLVNSW